MAEPVSVVSRKPMTSDDVAGHYNDLDRFYRDLWGEHLHHGLWLTGKESPDEATIQLTEHLADQMQIEPGQRVCDIGCGYGATSRYLAKERNVKVTGLTISSAQHRFAMEKAAGKDNPSFLLENWERNSLADESMDGAISIECVSHVENKQVYFDQIARVLKPGRRAVFTVWLACDEPTRFQQRHLLELICREGRLPGMGTVEEYAAMIRHAGLEQLDFEDVSRKVRKTWRICARRLGLALFTRPSYWRFLFTRQSRHAIFLVTVYRILRAYQVGAMRYGIFVLRRPK